MSISRARRVVFTFYKLQEVDLRDMHRTHLMAPTKCPLEMLTKLLQDLKILSPEHHSSDILCFLSVDNVVNTSKDSSGLWFIQKASGIILFVGNEWQKGFSQNNFEEDEW